MPTSSGKPSFDQAEKKTLVTLSKRRSVEDLLTTVHKACGAGGKVSVEELQKKRISPSVVEYMRKRALLRLASVEGEEKVRFVALTPQALKLISVSESPSKESKTHD